jgi:hypothetical protein
MSHLFCKSQSIWTDPKMETAGSPVAGSRHLSEGFTPASVQNVTYLLQHIRRCQCWGAGTSQHLTHPPICLEHD